MDTKGEGVQVGVVLGSASDLDKVKPLFGVLDEFGVSYEVAVISAHRTPGLLEEYARSVPSRGVKVVIAAAGLSAALPGVLASLIDIPVIGIPVSAGTLDGIDALLAIHEGALGKIGIVLRKMLAQRDAKYGHVTCGGELARVRQAVSIAEHRSIHAQLTSLRSHQAREICLRAAKQFAHRCGRVVGGLRNHGQDRRFHRDGAALAHAELGRRLRRRLRREDDGCGLRDATAGERFEGHIERHHLGQRSRIAPAVGVL